MPQQPATSTDRLANVIEVIQLGRKTGILTAERDTGALLEHGMITFIKGQVAQASVSQHARFPDFTAVKTWGACRFAFIPTYPSKMTPQITQPQPPASQDTSPFRDVS